MTSFDVARPYRQVVDTLRTKSSECLAVTATSSGTVFQGNMAMRETATSVYKPTVSVTDQRMELAVQVGFGKAAAIETAIRDWATGASTSCPDLSG